MDWSPQNTSLSGKGWGSSLGGGRKEVGGVRAGRAGQQ